MNTSTLLAWSRCMSHLKLPAFRAVRERSSRRMCHATLGAELQEAFSRDVDRIDLVSAAPEAVQSLAVCAMGLRLSLGKPVGAAIRASVEQVVGSRTGTLVDVFEPLTVEERLSQVETVLREILSHYEFTLLDGTCIEHAIDFARWGWDDDLAARVPLTISILAENVRPDNQAGALFAIAILAAFASVHAVPAAHDKVTLMLALQEHAPHADQRALTSFLHALAEGHCYGRLAYELARTEHEGLLTAFARVAPASALEWLEIQLEIVRSGATRRIGIA